MSSVNGARKGEVNLILIVCDLHLYLVCKHNTTTKKIGQSVEIYNDTQVVEGIHLPPHISTQPKAKFIKRRIQIFINNFFLIFSIIKMLYQIYFNTNLFFFFYELILVIDRCSIFLLFFFSVKINLLYYLYIILLGEQVNLSERIIVFPLYNFLFHIKKKIKKIILKVMCWRCVFSLTIKKG